VNKINLYNQISHEIVKNYNTYLHAEDVNILKTIEVAPHHTIVNKINTKLAQKIYEVALKLKEIDSSLSLNGYRNYHITLFWKNLDANLPSKTYEIGKIIHNHTYSFE